MSIPLCTLAAALAFASPTVTVDRAQAAPGERLLVRLAGWPAGTVTIELCGPAGCAVDAGAQTYVPRSGAGGAPLAVTAPPGGCPCVVRVRSLDGAATATTPVSVTGASATTAWESSGVSDPVLTTVEVEDDAWLGWPTRRTLVLHLRNDGAAPAPVALSVTAGRGSAPTGFVPAPRQPDLAPGEARTVRVPVDVPLLPLGRYTVAGEVTGAGSTTRFTATTATYPWFLPGLLGLLVTALAVREIRFKRKGATP